MQHQSRVAGTETHWKPASAGLHWKDTETDWRLMSKDDNRKGWDCLIELKLIKMSTDCSWCPFIFYPDSDPIDWCQSQLGWIFSPSLLVRMAVIHRQSKNWVSLSDSSVSNSSQVGISQLMFSATSPFTLGPSGTTLQIYTMQSVKGMPVEL